MLTATDVDELLSKLCVELGFCLPPSAITQFQNTRPVDIDSFTDAVFVAEGLDPRLADRGVRTQVRAIVREAFVRERTP